MTMLETALAYHRAGLVILPNEPATKFPQGIANWQNISPDEATIRGWYTRWPHRAIGVRDVEGLDFDNKGAPSAEELYAQWADLVERVAPGLAQRLLMESTPSGGFHVVWRCDVIAGNQKLALRAPTPEELRTSPKLKSVTLIETRGRGGQFQVAPSPGYRLLRGEWTALPSISPAERQIILDCARALSLYRPSAVVNGPRDGKPGTAYSERATDSDIDSLLTSHGWLRLHERGDNTYYTRPGKEAGVSASWSTSQRVFYVFSSNASPFESDRGYGAFGVYALLEHDGDYKAAARALAAAGFGDPPPETPPLALRHGRAFCPSCGAEVRRSKYGGWYCGEHTPALTWPDGAYAPGVPEASEPRPAQEYVGDWRHQGVTLRQLKRTHFHAMQWVIEGLLPEGACLLAGKPKTKKSWLALGVAMAVAMGGKALGKLDVAGGGVLYLDLESNQRRMKSRARAMLGDAVEWPDNFTIFTEWPRGTEAIDRLDTWMIEHPETRMVVVDILQKIRAPRDKNANPYDEDYTAIQSLNAFAERHRITVIVIHHTRKGKADDVFDEISGTTGLTGGTATMWIIGRVAGELDQSVLHVRGRDVDDAELALGWDDYLCQHVIEGDAALAAQSRERQEILDAMEPGEQYGPKDIAAMVGKSVSSVKFLLRHLLEDDFITKAAYGKYERLIKTPYSAYSAHSAHSPYSAYSPKSEGFEPRVSESKAPPLTLGSASGRAKTPQNGKSEQSKGFSVEGVRVGESEEWRVWDDATDEIVARFPTEAEASAEVQRREGSNDRT